ncbi:MAG: DUF4091 domain-containing protein [Sedimentisphaerales bacterium]|nr:DUF4091 domain-containing protein [Sedimentisphaerales bacterium]
MITASRYVRLFVLLMLLVIPSLNIVASEAMLWPVDPLTKVMRTDRPASGISNLLEISGARGETVSAQAIFRPANNENAVSVDISTLQHTEVDARIPETAVKLQWVRYIDIDRNTRGIPDDELVAKAPTSIPDPFWENPTMALKANQSQPIWVEVSIPKQAKPGDYEGKLTLSASEQSLVLPVKLRVWDFDMPSERHLSVINWWRFPGLGFEHIKPYSEDYWQLLGDFCRFLVEHRQTDIQTSINLIEEKSNNQQGYVYETNRLEQYAEVAFKAGIRQIHLHSVGRRTARLTDPASRIAPNESALRRLEAWEKVVRRRHWQDRFLVSISDEPFIHHEESYAAIVDRVHNIAPSIRCVEAVEAKYLGELDIYVPKLSHLNLWYPHFKQVQNEGAELWFYTCCHPVGRYPNRFLDQSLLKVRVLHWLNYLYGLDGYLHWGLNHFSGDDPYTQEGISKGLPLGDRAIAYPGTKGLLGSLRFSAMRDGLQDFEYLWVLEKKLSDIKSKLGREVIWLDPRQRPLELCRRVVWSFHDYTHDSNVMLDTREAIAHEIENLQTDPLLIVQTSPSEGTVVPAGPRNIGVRGLVPPGAKVTLNGKPVENVRPSGYFLTAYFMPDNKPTITITVEHNGKKRSIERTFQVD